MLVLEVDCGVDTDGSIVVDDVAGARVVAVLGGSAGTVVVELPSTSEASPITMDVTVTGGLGLPPSPVLAGLYESTSIEGDAAAALWKVYYHFAADGSYTGAALVIGATHPEFQTLAGTWSLAGGVLDLGQGEQLTARAADGYLELASSGGVAVLHRVALQ